MKNIFGFKTGCLGLLVIFAGLTACNNSTDQSSNASSSTDTGKATVQAAAADTTAAARPAKKGRATVSMPAASKEKSARDKYGVYNKVEVMPEFPGGQTALASYVENHIEYPQNAIDDNKEGTVHVSFVVDEKGNVTDTKVTDAQKLGDGLDEQALKVVSNMPAWKPGKVKGRNVKTRLELPITFAVSA